MNETAANETDDATGASAEKAWTTPAVWPLAVIVALQVASVTIPGRIAPGTPIHFFGLMLGGAGSLALLIAWWFTRRSISFRDRALGFAMVAGAFALTAVFLFHPYMFPMPTITHVAPSIGLAMVPLFAIARLTGWRAGRRLIFAGVCAVLAAWCAVRSEGVDGNLAAGLAWRWTPTDEQLLAAETDAPAPADGAAGSPLELLPGDWPGFRGPDRDGRLIGVTIESDWDASPPKEVWRRRVGPGWGSVTIVDGLLFTQEQRGEQEIVAAYDAATGEPRWMNEVAARFEESAAGPGPRATPTFHQGQLFTTGACGVVQCLDAATGAAVWKRDLTEDTSAVLIEQGNWWGFASSPLVIDDADGRTLAIVYAGTPHPRERDSPPASDSVIAYDTATGEPAWTSGVGTHGYASPHAATLAGVAQVLVPSNLGLESLDPTTGERLWFYDWPSSEYPRVVQPTLLPGDRIALGTGYGFGTHTLAVTKAEDGWATATEWQSTKLKPYFNDLVHYEGHLYGFDGKFFTCLDAETGEVTWPRSVKRKAAFGHGQALLVEDAGLIVVVTETRGDVVLLEANPETLVVRGRIEALNGKTWNHPVIHSGRLYVRNGAEAACFELSTNEAAFAAR